MAGQDEQLVRLIADQVIRHLQRRGDAEPNLGPQEIRPPLGTCTGDYGQFSDRPDLVGKSASPRPAPPSDAASAVTPADEPPPPTALSGIVTAAQLDEAVRRDGLVRLAATARLTPLAADFVREKPQLVQRLNGQLPAASATSNGRWLLWIDGHCPHVQKLLERRGADFQASASPRTEAGLMQAVRDTAAAVRSGSLQGAVLFVRDAALATVASNRSPSLRAVVGTCPEAVGRAVKAVAANVLIIEYLYQSPQRMNEMVDVLLAARVNVPAPLQRELAEIHRSG